MPRSLDLHNFEVVLESDLPKPIESRPTFIVRSQTMRGHNEILNVVDRRTDRSLTTEQYFAEICDTLNKVLVGWRNMGDNTFGGTLLQDLLSYDEALELLFAVANNRHVVLDEKKD